MVRAGHDFHGIRAALRAVKDRRDPARALTRCGALIPIVLFGFFLGASGDEVFSITFALADGSPTRQKTKATCAVSS